MRQPPKQSTQKLFDKQPPASIEAEMSLLGALIVGPPLDQLHEIFALIGEADFYDLKHADIYRAIHTLWAKTRGKIDLVQINQVLSDAGGDGPDAVDIRYLGRLIEGVPSAANAIHFARIVSEKARLRRMIDALGVSLYDLYHSKGNPADETISSVLAKVTGAGQVKGLAKAVRLADAESDIFERIGRGERDTYPTGVLALDGLTGGVPKDDLLAILGYSSSGKTSFALDIALSIALGAQGRQIPVRIFSYEQNASRIAATALTRATGTSIHSLMNRGQLPTADEWAKITRTIDEHHQVDFEIIPDNMTAPAIFHYCQAEAAKKGRGIVLVDYVQNLPGFGPFVEDKPRIAESMRWLQRIGREAGWLCMVVSQVDKKTVKDNRRPGMADGLGAGEIEHASGMMISVWRPNQGEPRALSDSEHQWHLRQRQTEIAVLKNKYGEKGTSVVSFDAGRMCFREPNQEEREAWV